MLDNYEIQPNGVIKQIEREPFQYSYEYADKYNKLGDLGTKMSYLRLGHVIGSIGCIPKSIMDIGYGNGDFLRACRNIIPTCYGYDISTYPVPVGALFLQDPFSVSVDVITMYDVLEHFENIYSIKNLQAKYIVISLPHCHYHVLGDKWFENWKHRRPNEHLWHFDDFSLRRFMNEIGYDYVNSSDIEDTIRKGENEFNFSNILTAVFKKR